MIMRPAILASAILLSSQSHALACRGIFDLGCDIGRAAGKAAQDVGKGLENAGKEIGAAVSNSPRGLIPVRAYMKSQEIPPPNIGGYGIILFRSKPTEATKARYALVCQSFIANFPRNETSNVPISDQMITIWPIENPDSDEAKKDDCDYVLGHYDLNASELAIRDAHTQHAELDGEGPYLVGWSPSNARGNPDKLVLIVDFSGDNSQSTINHKFLFWKNKIVQNPSLWRSGYSLEGVKLAIKDFADQYGQSMLDAIKLTGGK